MNIVMMTNTYHPIVGGLERSVDTFSKEYRGRGHQVLVVAPEFDGTDEEKGVFRVPAIQNFNGTDFSVELPVPSELSEKLDRFKPDIIHTHHPFLIGDTALRVASKRDIPIVFTHHTLYEQYTHYVPGDSPVMKKFVTELTKGYANLCDHVIAPSPSIKTLLEKRGVKTPTSFIPTGIYCDKFQKGSGEVFRKFFDISQDSFLFGTIGRVAKEKNIDFLSDAAIEFLKKEPGSLFLLVGSGPDLGRIKKKFKKHRLAGRVVVPGVLQGNQLISAYKALDLFVFSSHTETQGLVLAEAMAASTPVLAVDAPGVRDIISDGSNGRMIQEDSIDDFTDVLRWFNTLDQETRGKMVVEARETSRQFDVPRCVEKMLGVYQHVIEQGVAGHSSSESLWQKSRGILEAEVGLISNLTTAAGSALLQTPVKAAQQISAKVLGEQ